MKKRVRTQPSNPFYSNEPAVSRKDIAGRPPVQNASLGNQAPRMVDKKPGRLSGVAGFADKKRPKTQKMQNPAFTAPLKTGPAKPVGVPKQGGHLRMSGVTGAHRIGAMKPLKKF